MAYATNGNFTISTTTVHTGPLLCPVTRFLAHQRQRQAQAFACALGWHGDHDPRCDARGFADCLHEYVPGITIVRRTP